MTVLLEYVTALLEYLGFLLQGMHQPKSAGLSPPPILSTFTINFNYLGFECLYSTAKLTPYLYGLLI